MSLYFYDENEAMQQVAAGDQYRADLRRMQEMLAQQGVTADTVTQFIQQGPNASPGLLGSAIAGGLTPEQYGELAMQDPGQDEFNWYDPTDWISEGLDKATTGLKKGAEFAYEYALKPFVRGSFAVLEGLSQELIQRPLAAVQAGGMGAADQDVTTREAYNQYGTSALFQALGNVIGEKTPDEVGKGFDLGTGFFTGGAAAEQQQAARQLTVQGEKANLGRLYIDPVFSRMGLSPGDRTYDITAGVTQFGVDVLTDPSILLTAGTGGVAKVAGRAAGAGARAFGRSADDVARIQRSITNALTVEGLGPRMRAAGSFDEVLSGGRVGQVTDDFATRGVETVRTRFNDPRNRLFEALDLMEFDEAAQLYRPRRGVQPQEIGERFRTIREAGGEQAEAAQRAVNEMVGLVEGPNGRSVLFDKAQSFFRNDGLLEAIAGADAATIARSIRVGRETSMPSEFISALGRATDKDEVAAILTEAITNRTITDRNFYGGFANRVGNALRNTPVLGEKIDKFSGIAARGFLDANDKDTALAKLSTLFRQSGLTDAENQNWLIHRIGDMQTGNQTEMFQIASEAYERVGARLMSDEMGFSAKRVQGLMKAYNDELTEFRKYYTDEAGEVVNPGHLPVQTVKKFTADGTIDVPIPQPHLLNEFNKMGVPLPDIDDIRRASTKSDIARQVYESNGWAWTNKSLRFVTRQLFKPLVLLRPAYIARTQLDDQLRMWAAGVDSIWSDPRHLIQMAMKAPDELVDLASTDPSIAAHARKVLNHSILDVDGDSLQKPMMERFWTTIQKKVPSNADDLPTVKEELGDFITAWRHELGQLNDDQIASFLARRNLNVDDAVVEIMGGKVKDPALAAKVEERMQAFRVLEDTFGNSSSPADVAAPWSEAPEGGKLRGLHEAAKSDYYEHVVRREIDDRLTSMQAGRAPDTPVDPVTGQTVDDVLDEEAIPLSEYLDRQADELEDMVRSDPNMESRASRQFSMVDRFVAPNQFQWMVRRALLDGGFDESVADEYAEQLAKEWTQWTHSGGDPVLHQNTIRESGLLNQFARAQGKMGVRSYRGQAMPASVWQNKLANGELAEGQIWRWNRLSSATTDPKQPGTFMNLGASEIIGEGRGQPVRVLFRMDGETRGANLGWSSQESEMLLPEQSMIIRGTRKLEPDEDGMLRYADPDTGDEFEFVGPRDTRFDDPDMPPMGDETDVWVVDLESVKDGSITQKVMNEGDQPFMRDMNGGSYDGSPESLAGTAWDELSVSERAEYEQINAQIQKWINRPRGSGDVAYLQYHSEIRHLVDNAPTVPDPIYLPGSAVTDQLDELDPGNIPAGFSSVDSPRTLDADNLPGRGVELRSDRNLAFRETFRGRNRDQFIPERISRGTISPDMIDEDVVVRLPRGSQGLRVADDGTYMVPPTGMRVTNVRTKFGKTIVDVEIDYQPRKGQMVQRDVPGTSSLRDAIARVANGSNNQMARLLEDEEALRGYLQSVVDRIQIKTGGMEDVLDALAGRPPAGVDPEDWADLFGEGMDGALEDFLARRVLDERAPTTLKQRRFADGEGDPRGALEAITAYGYEYIVSKPAAYLSRYPAWVEFTTRDMAALMRQASDDAVRREVLDIAMDMGATDKQMRRLKEAADAAAGTNGTIGSAEEVREFALMHATESVENLLFDVTNKSAFQDAFDLIFPFVDAWKEGLGVWGRMLKENPEIYMKALAGMRGAEETGMIYTNERGERMFAMPFSGTIGNFIERMNEGQRLGQAARGALEDTVRGELDDDQISDTQTKFGFNLQGVNLMLNSIGPGFGPIVQWPAGAFLPETPDYQGLREFINPYGNYFEEGTDFLNPDTYTKALMPSWFNKIRNAWTEGGVDPVQWNSMVHDSLRALEMSGDYDPTSMADRQRLTEDAERSARWMLMVRGIVHGVSVSGPSANWAVKTDGVDEDFVPYAGWEPHADPDGVWHEINSLASAYYDLYDQYGDSVIATEKFMEAYGVTPAYLRTPKSEILTGLPATKEAAYWAEENQAAITKYPSVAGYFAPPDEGNEKFDYGVYVSQFEQGLRSTISPEQQIALANRSQAQQAYYNAKDRLENSGLETGQQRAALSQIKAVLDEQYPGWQIQVTGITSIPTDQKIQQLEMAAFDPDLASSPLSGPLQQYFTVREQMLQSLRAEVGADNATLARQDAEKYRQALQQIGVVLVSSVPEFRGPWELLKREVE